MLKLDRHTDLHMHTTASDGEYRPADLVRLAREAGLTRIAITDHDTLDGIDEALEAGRQLGVEVIAGVELSTKFRGKSVDVLGYEIQKRNELHALLEEMRKRRENRAELILEQFGKLGMPLTMEEVKAFSGDGVIGRPHIAKAVVKKGYVPDFQTAFDEYLADGKPCAVDKKVLTPEEAIRLIRDAGGYAVLAHPVHLHDDGLVRELLGLGFDGIEVWHREHGPDEVRRYRALAEEFGLGMTGGSDFHDDRHVLGRFGYDE